MKKLKRSGKILVFVVFLVALLALGIALFWHQRPQIGLVSFPFSLNPMLKLVSPKPGVAYETSEQTTYLFLSDLPDEECSGENPRNFGFEYFPVKIGDFLAAMQGRFCENNMVSFIPVDLPNGALVYRDYCESCHGSLNNPETAKIGPWLGNIHSEAANRIPETTVAQYVYESIVAPNNYIASGCINRLLA